MTPAEVARFACPTEAKPRQRLHIEARNPTARDIGDERCGHVHMFIAPGTFKQTEESPNSQAQPRSA